jgi:hypothetical protein
MPTRPCVYTRGEGEDREEYVKQQKMEKKEKEMER